jgi:hypothetical protein
LRVRLKVYNGYGGLSNSGIFSVGT